MIISDFPRNGDELKVVSLRKPAQMYIRFGHFGSERSLNWVTGDEESGISVYPAIMSNGIVMPDPEWTRDISAYWETFKDRTIYALTGRQSGVGSDGEPLLIPSSIVIRGISHPRVTTGLPIDIYYTTH